MAPTRLTLIVEDLAALIAAAPRADGPALARTFARGRALPPGPAGADALRMGLFADGFAGPAPVAALTAVTNGLADRDDARYWLRIDPVTLAPDMTRVFLAGHGLADVDAPERDALRAVVDEALAEAGQRLLHGASGHWLLALGGPPSCAFTPLADALGRDLAEVLPEGAEGLEWRRLMTEVQVALHHSEVNRQRRADGRREINGVWAWGGGRVPGTVRGGTFDAVFSDDPVSRGLGVLAGCAVHGADLRRAIGRGGRVLLDWRCGRDGAPAELERLNEAVDALLRAAGRGDLEFTLLGGAGHGRAIDRRALRRFWRRARPLSDYVAATAAGHP